MEGLQVGNQLRAHAGNLGVLLMKGLVSSLGLLDVGGLLLHENGLPRSLPLGCPLICLKGICSLLISSQLLSLSLSLLCSSFSWAFFSLIPRLEVHICTNTKEGQFRNKRKTMKIFK